MNFGANFWGIQGAFLSSKFYRNSILFLILFLVSSCSQLGFGSKPSSKHLPSGFIKLDAAGKVISLGVDSGASSDEMPKMYAKFSSNFNLYSHEVRKDEFQALMGYVPVGAENDSVDAPVRFVSWYEAIFFCNRMSVKNGLDSVYSYSGASKDASGRIDGLIGIKVKYAAEGIRLPTEAEWMFAAKKIPSASLLSSAWYADNSGGVVHKVEQRKAYDGLYDMAGNLMEWVSDGMATHPNHVL